MSIDVAADVAGSAGPNQQGYREFSLGEFRFSRDEFFACLYNDSYRKAELDYYENVETPRIRETFKSILDDWTNDGFDPFASPHETGPAFGIKHGSNTTAVTRRRVAAQRMV